MMYETKISPTMQERKRYDYEWALKTLDESGVFAGYASVFSVVDEQRDIMLPGAFVDSLTRRGDVKLLWQHDMAEPIGRIEELREDENGLYIKGRLSLDVARGKEAYSLLKQGILSGLSIGYSPIRYRYDPETGVRLLKQVDLWEVSLVTFPANTSARITVVKQAASDEEIWQQAVRTGEAMKFMEAVERAEAILLS